MPPVSKVISLLPPEIRQLVEERMLANGFSDYEGLAQWVDEQGYDISGDSLWRYGKALKREFTSARFSVLQARLLAEQAPDHKGQMMQAVMQVVLQKLLSALSEAEKFDHVELCRLVHAIAELARASLPRQKWAAELKKEKKELRLNQLKAKKEAVAEYLGRLEFERIDPDPVPARQDPDDLSDIDEDENDA